MMQKRLSGIGNPLVDICANVGAGYVKKWGLKINDAINAEKCHLGLFDEIQQYFKVSVELGGCTLNTLRVFQWLSGERHAAYFSGAVGDDIQGQIISRRLTNLGMDIDLEVTKKSTGRTVSLITDDGMTHIGNRSLVADISSAEDYSLDFFDKIFDQLSVSEMFYQSAWFILGKDTFDVAIRIAQEACYSNKLYMLNIGGEYVCQNYTGRLKALLPYADYLVGNGDEIISLAENLDWAETEIEDILLRLETEPFQENEICPRVKRTVIATQGSEETLVARNGQIYRFRILSTIPADIIDTTAAGDAFCGGFLHILSLYDIISHEVINEAVECGHWAAREIIMRRGCAIPQACHYYSWKKGISDYNSRQLG